MKKDNKTHEHTTVKSTREKLKMDLRTHQKTQNIEGGWEPYKADKMYSSENQLDFESMPVGIGIGLNNVVLTW